VHETEHPPPYSVEVKNVWIMPPLPVYCHGVMLNEVQSYVFMAQCLIKHRDACLWDSA
jgi:hypothetical protein